MVGTMTKKQTVLLTRPLEQSLESVSLFEAAGFQVLVAPAVEIVPIEDTAFFVETVNRLSEFSWLIFSSANGVRFFCRLMEQESLADWKKRRTCSIAAVGPATAAALESFGLSADRTAEDRRAEGLVELLFDEAVLGKHFLSIRGSRGRDVLKKGLESLGATVEELAVYQSSDVVVPDEKIAELFEQGRIDYTTVTSPAIARSLVRLYGERLRKTSLVSISPLTGSALTELGFPAKKEAADSSMEGILAALLSD